MQKVVFSLSHSCCFPTHKFTFFFVAYIWPSDVCQGTRFGRSICVARFGIHKTYTARPIVMLDHVNVVLCMLLKVFTCLWFQSSRTEDKKILNRLNNKWLSNWNYFLSSHFWFIKISHCRGFHTDATSIVQRLVEQRRRDTDNLLRLWSDEDCLTRSPLDRELPGGGGELTVVCRYCSSKASSRRKNFYARKWVCCVCALV